MATAEVFRTAEPPDEDRTVPGETLDLDGVELLLRELGSDGRLVHLERFPARPARHRDLERPLPAAVAAAIGVDRFWTHQAQAIAHALAGRHTVTTTPTASGKTLCYNAPVLSTMLQDPASRALYLYPTKALAQDQLAELQALCEQLETSTGASLGVFTYDGDTPADARRTIRNSAHIVLSNPDMLHAGILPFHNRWKKLFENLRFVIIDELRFINRTRYSRIRKRRKEYFTIEI